MSTTAPAPEVFEAPATPTAEAPAAPPTPTPAPAPAADPAIRTFRGRTLEELLPQIREALGPDAIVLRQRDGLMGGIGGFFQQRFVEVDARAGAPRIDTYDEEPAAPAPEPPAPAEAEAPTGPTGPDTFAAFLAEATDGGPRIRPGIPGSDSRSSVDPPAEPTPLAAQPATLTHELTARGMSHAFAERLVQDAEAHELPFAHGDLRTAVRRALARKLPTALPHRAGALAVAFAGPGSTGCADALATAYKRAGRDARAVASLDKARALIERGGQGDLLAVDLPPIASERAEVDALADRVATLELDEIVVVLPAELDLPSARALADRLQPLAPTALALSLDAEGGSPGAAMELACTTRLPLAYVHDPQRGIAPADPTTLAERLLP